MSPAYFLLPLLALALAAPQGSDDDNSSGSSSGSDEDFSSYPPWFQAVIVEVENSGDNVESVSEFSGVTLQSEDDTLLPVVTCLEGYIIEFENYTVVLPNPDNCDPRCDSDDLCNDFTNTFSSEAGLQLLVTHTPGDKPQNILETADDVALYVDNQFFADFHKKVLTKAGSTFLESHELHEK